MLREYARWAQADPDQWWFLTGSRQEIWKLAQEGFKLPVTDRDPTSQSPILHSQKFVLVDRHGRIHGYYDALEPDGPEALLRDMSALLDAERTVAHDPRS